MVHLPGPPPQRVALSLEDRAQLMSIVRAATSTQRDVIRARIVLLSADGESNAAIAHRLAITESTVRKWRGRYASEGRSGLRDRPRHGRRPIYDGVVRCQVVSGACEPVSATILRTEWTLGSLRQTLVDTGLCEAISERTIGRILSEADLRPHHMRLTGAGAGVRSGRPSASTGA